MARALLGMLLLMILAACGGAGSAPTGGGGGGRTNFSLPPQRQANDATYDLSSPSYFVKGQFGLATEKSPAVSTRYRLKGDTSGN